MTRILIVEDNLTIADALGRNLRAEGYDVEIATSGDDGLQRITSSQPDLVILDLLLPKMKGYDVLRRMRAEGCQQPVLILSALSTERDKVMGFRMGADDFVTKPFGVRELLARIEVLLRRRAVAPVLVPTVERFAFGDILVDRAARVVRRGGALVAMKPMEFDLLLAFLLDPEVVLSRQALLEAVWRYDASISSRTVDVHIAELRRKLEPVAERPVHFVTVRKVGYAFYPDGLR
ncbi:MAG: response regulator transcription factor [Gemmatimonadales bacterium]